MLRLTQILQNLYLRIEGLFGVLFKSIVGFFGNIFGFFARLFGLNASEYFLESNEAQGTKQASEKQPTKTIQDNTPKISPTIRRPNAKVDNYYLNMARDVKKN